MENETSQIKVLFGFGFFFLTTDAKGLLIYFIHYQLEKNPHVIGSENLIQLPDRGINSFLAHEKESSLEICRLDWVVGMLCTSQHFSPHRRAEGSLLSSS